MTVGVAEEADLSVKRDNEVHGRKGRRVATFSRLLFTHEDSKGGSFHIEVSLGRSPRLETSRRVEPRMSGTKWGIRLGRREADVAIRLPLQSRRLSAKSLREPPLG